MVKILDENFGRGEILDHVGIALWRAASVWRREMGERMAEAGYPWHNWAAGAVLANLGPDGIGQAKLTEQMGMSKQAVQQLVDQLEAAGVVRRVPDPEDRRARRIELTELGLEDMRVRNQVKRDIESRYRALLGEDAFDGLIGALNKLAGK